jgi:hypothetical protein
MLGFSFVPKEKENTALADRAMKWLCVGERDSRWIKWSLVLVAALYFSCLAMFGMGPINRYANDALVLLDGGWRLLSGQIPYRDFYLALGPLEFMITAGGMLLTHGSPQGIAVGNAAFGITVGLWGWLLSRRRMLTVPSLIVTAWLILTATSPTPLGHPWNVMSCAMIYNRHGYALLGIVLVECAFASEYNRFWGGVSSGIALILLAFLKLNFFGAAFLLLLATVPLRREEMRRAWGILAGAACAVAAFSLYLRFGIFAFLSDMLFATQARGSSLTLQGTIGDFAGSAEMVVLAIIAMVVTLMVSLGKFWQRRGVRLILLGCIVIATAGLLKQTNAFDTGFELVTLWTAVLVGQLAAAYPQADEKAAIVAVVALGLASIAVEFFMDAESMRTLVRYHAPSVRSMGASIAGDGMERLKFYDPEVSDLPSIIDSSRSYVAYVNDGLALLTWSAAPEESILTLGFHNPFSYILRRKPAVGGSPFLLLGNSISETHLLEASRVFGNADLIMVPHYPSSHQRSDADIEMAYHAYLSQHFTFVASSQWWSLYRRKG